MGASDLTILPSITTHIFRIPINDAAIRIAELKALVAQGRAEADADNVRAGFFGGDGELAFN